MGINPDTYAPASPSSAAAAAGGCGAPFPATRHMAQWESARLEAEARLSRESLLFSSTSSAAAAESEPADDSHAAAAKPEADFFLRIWNSEVGDAFRKPPLSALGAAAEPQAADEEIAPTTAESKSCCLSVSAPSGPDSSSSNEVDETSDDTYQLYLNLAGDELGLFQGQMGSFSLFSTDLNDVVFLDTAFK